MITDYKVYFRTDYRNLAIQKDFDGFTDSNEILD